MEEVVHPRDGGPVVLRPCPAWCTGDGHFPENGVIDSDDGFHHYGAEVAVPTSYRMFGLDGPEAVVKIFLISWTHPLDAEPGPTRIELQFGTAETNTDMCVELTPAQARAVAQGLLELAATAERDGQR